MKTFFLSLVLFTTCVFNAHRALATTPPESVAFETPIKQEALDTSAFAEWFDGQEKTIESDARESKPQWVLWTDKSRPGHSGVTFGDSKASGPRHLRIGFYEPQPVGTLMTRGGGRPSVLKPDAPYPGDLNDEEQWIRGERLLNGKVTDSEADRADYALWVFPAGTTSCALRFTHEPDPTDSTYAGWPGAALVTEERFNNLAPLAVASTGTNTIKAPLLNNGKEDGWGSWENREKNDPASAGDPVISPDHPQWAMLTWPAPVQLSGLAALSAGFGSAEVQSYKGPEGRHPSDSHDEDWESVGTYSGIMPGYPLQLWPNHLDFGRNITTRAVRLRMTEAAKKKACTRTSLQMETPGPGSVSSWRWNRWPRNRCDP
jgi:hypothetical protein